MKIAVVGIAYVGLPLWLQFARTGVSVLGLDVDCEKVDVPNERKSYIKHIESTANAGPVSAATFEAFDADLISTNHSRVNYQEHSECASFIINTSNAMAGINTRPGQVWKA